MEDLVVIVLDRPRHEKLIADIRAAGARIRLIGDGDLSAGISAAVIGTGVHAVMGIGGAPEGVLTAAALRCLNGEIVARLVVSKPEHEERLAKMGVKDPKRIYHTEDLAPGKKMIFACTGVTDGNLLRGVRFFGEGIRTQSMILTLDDRQVRFVDSVHLEKRLGHQSPIQLALFNTLRQILKFFVDRSSIVTKNTKTQKCGGCPILASFARVGPEVVGRCSIPKRQKFKNAINV